MTRCAHILAAKRTWVAPRYGAYRDISLPELAAAPIAACLRAADIKSQDIDEVIVANAIGPGGNPARSIALQAGLPDRIAGLTIDRQCCGGLDAIALAAALIAAGQAKILLAGGVESYSTAPARFARHGQTIARRPYRQAPFTPWPERDPDMDEAASALATCQSISRRQQDEWAIASHRKARCAAGRLSREVAPIVGVPLTGDSFTRDLGVDLCRRARSLCGDITTANASVAADAAAFCLVAAEERPSPGSPSTRILAAQTRGGDPIMPGLAPVAAAQRAMDRVGVTASALAAAEIMEAYAVQAISCVEQLELPYDIVNIGGGSLARGHPIGASGSILAVRLHHELITSGGIGLAAIAAAGGIGSALLLEHCGP